MTKAAAFLVERSILTVVQPEHSKQTCVLAQHFLATSLLLKIEGPPTSYTGENCRQEERASHWQDDQR